MNEISYREQYRKLILLKDVGNPNYEGDASYCDGQITINGGGCEIWDDYDELHYVYQSLTGYRSNDGSNWNLVGSKSITMPVTVHVGLFAVSGVNDELCTGEFDNVAITE